MCYPRAAHLGHLMGRTYKDEIIQLQAALTKERRLRKEAEAQCAKLIMCLAVNNKETQSLREAVRRKAKVKSLREIRNDPSDGLVVGGSCND